MKSGNLFLRAMVGLAILVPAQSVAAGERESGMITLREGAEPAAAETAAVDFDVLAAPAPVVASFYGARFAGRLTANGEIFDPALLTAAHKELPFGTMVKVTNVANGKSVTVRINDRGPFHGNREIDLSRRAAEEIGMVSRGVGKVVMEVLD